VRVNKTRTYFRPFAGSRLQKSVSLSGFPVSGRQAKGSHFLVETGCTMSRSEYQHYADECLLWAAEAKNEKHRQIYLEMAKAWTLAAKLAVQTRDASSSEYILRER
jgi:hypothetical protein